MAPWLPLGWASAEDTEIEVEVCVGEAGESYSTTFVVASFSHVEAAGGEGSPLADDQRGRQLRDDARQGATTDDRLRQGHRPEVGLIKGRRLEYRTSFGLGFPPQSSWGR